MARRTVARLSPRSIRLHGAVARKCVFSTLRQPETLQIAELKEPEKKQCRPQLRELNKPGVYEVNSVQPKKAPQPPLYAQYRLRKAARPRETCRPRANTCRCGS